MKKLKHLSFRAFVFVSLVAGILLICSSLGQFFDPISFWPAAIVAIGFPFLIIANVVIALVWLFIKKKLALIPLICLLASSWCFPRFFQFGSKEEASGVKIMSFNVRLFDLYNWSGNRETRDRIFDLLSKEQPDILCIQEFYQTNDKREHFKTLDTMLTFLQAQEYHVHYTTTQYEKRHNWGIITLSKYPIIGEQTIAFDNSKNNVCIASDIVIEKDTLRVFNAHLASLHIGKQEYAFIENPTEKDQEEQLDQGINLTKLLKRAFMKRSTQIAQLKGNLTSSKYPAILCGDFNDTPSSYAYNEIAGVMEDAFIQSGSGSGRTYVGKFPSFRIDYIFVPEGYSTNNFVTHDEVLSDHKAISCYVGLPQD